MRAVKRYQKRKGSKKQKLELNYYNSFADKIASYIIINNVSCNSKNKN